MSTVTIARADVATLREGDVITHIDGRAVGPFTVSGPATETVIPIDSTGRTYQVNIYPDTNIGAEITVDRPDVVKKKATADRKPRRRFIGGITFINTGERMWETEDGRYHVYYQEAGVTECERDHPVKLTWPMIKHAQENRGVSWAEPILNAVRSGKSGFICEAGSEHSYYAWMVWDNVKNDYAYDIRDAETFSEAAETLAFCLK